LQLGVILAADTHSKWDSTASCFVSLITYTPDSKEENIVNWETPSFIQVNMNAEINSYQDDFADSPDLTEPTLEVPMEVTSPQD
jgi:hypothetical protein